MDGFVVHADQPKSAGGEDSAPAAYDLFLASIALCAGTYALAFLQSRGLSSEGLRIRQTIETSPDTHLPRKIEICVTPPAALPSKYSIAFLRAIENCKIKKTIQSPPEVLVKVSEEESHVPSHTMP